MRQILELNNNWYYKPNFSEEDIKNNDYTEYENIHLPHANVEVPYNYFDDKIYQFISCYKKKLDISKSNKRVFIDFEGVMTYCKVYLNENFLSTSNTQISLNIPIKIITGSYDFPVFSSAEVKKYFEQFDDVEIVEFKEAGHYPMIESPVLFASKIESWIH